MRTERDQHGKLVTLYDGWEEFYKMHPETRDKITIRGYRTEGDLSEQHNFPEHPEVQDILIERQKTHGEFTDNARVMQWLKNIVRDEPTWTHTSYVQREALEMILHKIGRIVTGNPNEPDHWLDIEGYARLARERIEVTPQQFGAIPTKGGTTWSQPQ